MQARPTSSELSPTSGYGLVGQAALAASETSYLGTAAAALMLMFLLISL